MDVIKSIFVWIAGVVLIFVTFPLNLLIWLLVLPFDRNRIVTHWILMYESCLLTRLVPIWKIDMEGREKAIRGTTYVIISNHQSILDILILNCLRYKYKWISKIEVYKLPFLGWYLRMADYITVNRGNEESKAEMLENAGKCLDKGISIMIFPEGTRSHDMEIGFFKRGAFLLAMEARVPLLPVILDGTGNILPKHGFIFGSGHHITVRVLDPVQPEEFGTDDPDILAGKMNNMMRSELENLRNVTGTR
jgi:1-acyl-sn-glycerol-3-phosphate acyltransferase